MVTKGDISMPEEVTVEVTGDNKPATPADTGDTIVITGQGSGESHCTHCAEHAAAIATLTEQVGTLSAVTVAAAETAEEASNTADAAASLAVEVATAEPEPEPEPEPEHHEEDAAPRREHRFFDDHPFAR